MDKKNILEGLAHAAANFQRLEISLFWETRAHTLEQQAITLFRQAGVARESAKAALHLDDAGAESVFKLLKAREEVKTVVEVAEGEGKAN